MADVVLLVAAVALAARFVATLLTIWLPVPVPESNEDRLKRWYVENDVSIEALEREVEREWKNPRDSAGPAD